MRKNSAVKIKQKIVPFLWFDDQAEEAVNFYTSIFKNSKIWGVTRYGKAGAKASGRPEGTVMTVDFEIEGQRFMGISAGPVFKFNPSISFHVRCKTKDEVDRLFEKLSKGGTVLMELGKYPFSERYGWTQDKYGVSWQVIFAGKHEIKQKFIPALMFVGEVCGKAEEAVNFYTSIFQNAKVLSLTRYGKGEVPDKEGTIKYAAFTLEGQEFGAMESAYEHKFGFNEAISFMVSCSTQEEIDYFWGKLSAVPQAEQCGWLKDKFGVSWQIVPTVLGEIMQDKDPRKSERVMEALLPMKKIDIKTLKQAYARESIAV